MRALISGAGGFCGRHLVAYLESIGLEVHTLGSTITSTHHHYAEPLNVELLKHAVAEAKPDYVFHLAGVVTSIDPTVYYQINCAYAAGLLQALEVTGQGMCPVLLVGTSAEYGAITAAELPISENTIAKPYNHYGISKLAQTQLGMALSNSGRPLVMVRPFNIVGPGMPKHLALQSFANQIANIIKKERKPVIEVGNLSSARDFIEVENTVRIFWELIQIPEAYHQVINICSGKAITMSSLLEQLVALSGHKIEIQVDPNRMKSVEIPVHYGDPAKLQKLTGRIPEFDQTASLRRILEHSIKDYVG